MERIELWLTTYEQIIDKVLTIVAMLVGGLLTYWATEKSNRKEAERKLLLEKRDVILLPFCTALEDLIEYLLSPQQPLTLGSDSTLSEKSNKLLEYLKADKRIFLHKDIRQMLTNYRKSIDSVRTTLNMDAKTALLELQKNLEQTLVNYEGIEQAIDINVGFYKDSVSEVRRWIVNRHTPSPLYLINNIIFVFGYEDDSQQYASFSMDEDFYKEIWYPIQSGYISLNDLNLPPEKEMSVDLLRFLHENSDEAVEQFNDVITKSTVYDEYIDMIENLQLMQSHVLLQVDDITDW